MGVSDAPEVHRSEENQMATAPRARGKLQPTLHNSRTGYESKDQSHGFKDVTSWNPQNFDEERLRLLSTAGGNLTEAR